MKANHLIALLNPNINTLKVKFPVTSKLYTYLFQKTENIVVGDKVVVFVENSKEFKVVEVVEVNASTTIDVDTDDRRYKFIVQKLDTAQYDKLTAAHNNAEKKFNELEASRAARKALDEYLLLNPNCKEELMSLVDFSDKTTIPV
jgi:hypothetical protein